MSIEEGYANISYGKVYFQIFNPKGKQTPLIILPGGPGAPHEYLHTLSELQLERPIVFFDQLGSGQSDEPPHEKGRWSLERITSEIEELIDWFNFPSFHLFSHSASTAFALILARKRKDWPLESLTLASPIASTKQWKKDQDLIRKKMAKKDQQAIKKALETNDFTTKGYEDALSMYQRKHWCLASPVPHEIQTAFDALNPELVEGVMGTNPFEFTGSLSTLDEYSLLTTLNKIQIPVLITVGEHDMVSEETARKIAHKLPCAMLEIFPDSAHMHFAEAPEAYLNLMKYFIKFEARHAA
ncbi:MAG: Proline iminopeptidase [Chlamydiia bacterium]|nr:Proline iminopeptidase [Chlamydiia bacterium]